MSTIWVPMVNTGFNALRESWKTMAILDPRSGRSALASRADRFWPSKTIDPLVWRKPAGAKPIMARAVRVLPLPVSPTMAVIAWRRRLNVTSFRVG